MTRRVPEVRKGKSVSMADFLDPTQALSPLDGRYAEQVSGLTAYFSEAALIKYRFRIEVEWLTFIAQRPELPEVRPLTCQEEQFLRSLVDGFSSEDVGRVKDIERQIRHDVKSVEYYLKDRLEKMSLSDVREFVHFCCTSEDINNLSYALMVKEAIGNEWLPAAEAVVQDVANLARMTRNCPMLSRTHSQAASPTTFGKELAVFVYRWQRQLKQLRNAEYLGKFNGAVGAFNAHVAAYPDVPWIELSRTFVERLGLSYNPLTTQIEPHDYLAEIFHNLVRFGVVTRDFAQDLWLYISHGYVRQKAIGGEIGSSTMPHKVNPIDFENSEANAGISNSLFEYLAAKLPVSRLQRDLTDSSTLRNVGVAIGHSLLSLHSLSRGLSRIEVDEASMTRDLDDAWEVLGEAVQTILRKAGSERPYEAVKELTRGKDVTREKMREIVRTLGLSSDEEQRLLALTPATYTGLAGALVDVLDRFQDNVHLSSPESATYDAI